MITGTAQFRKPLPDVTDRIRLVLVASGCWIDSFDDGRLVRFSGPGRVGQYPVDGAFWLSVKGDTTVVEYQAQVARWDRFMGTLWAALFCWLIVPPILTYRAFRDDPRAFVENVLQGV